MLRQLFLDGDKSKNLYRCIMELGTNIIKHGFNDGKEHAIDFRILAKNGKVILRIRDDCAPFNVVNYHESHPEKTGEGGINLVFELAQNVKYSGIMGTNNLIIKL